LDGHIINSGSGILENITNITDKGEHLIIAFFGGDGNHTSGGEIKIVTVQAPQSTGGGPGGSSGGGGRTSVINNTGLIDGTKNLSVEFPSLDDVLISPGESKTIQINVRNNGRTFLNKCKITGSQEWFTNSDESRNINAGEITEFIININAPLDAMPEESPQISLECLEDSFLIPLKIIVLQSGMYIGVTDITLLSENELEVNYTVQGNSDFDEILLFKAIDSENIILSEKQEKISIQKEKTNKSIILELNNPVNGLIKITIARADDEVPLVEEFFVYDSSNSGLTGFTFFNGTGGTVTLYVIIAVIFGVIAFISIRRIMKIRKWEGH